MKSINKKAGKVIALGIIAALSVNMLAGCGKKVSDRDAEGRVVISVDGYPNKEGKSKDNFDKKIADFEAANPDIKVEPDTWIFDLQSFYAKAAGGQLPTVYTTNFTEVEQCMRAGYSADITDALSRNGYDGMLNEKIMEIMKDGDNVYALPTDAYLLGIAFNVKLFEQAGLLEADGTPKQPKDWYEMAEFAVKIKEATGQSGMALCSMSNYGGWLVTPIMWSFGVDFMEQQDDGSWKATFNSDEAVEALEYIKDLKWKYNVLPENTLIDDPEQSKLFAADKVGMILSLAGNVGNFAQYEMDPDNIGFMAFPAGPARHVTLLGGHVAQIEKDASEEAKDAVMKWLKVGNNFELTEAFKTSVQNNIDTKLEDGQLVGVNDFSIWSENSEARKFKEDIIKEKANCNTNHVKLYNEFIADCPAEIQAEEPVCAQELYGILDTCIQQVLTDENADCRAILEKANSDFQKNYLNNVQ